MSIKVFFVVFFCMLFAHKIADYNLQGCLADLKQKEWWQKQLGGLPLHETIYKNDWKVALLMHSFSWAFCIMVPVLFAGMWKHLGASSVLLVANTAIHFYVDDLKANKHSINLVEDQGLHFLQIICILAVSAVVLNFL